MHKLLAIMALTAMGITTAHAQTFTQISTGTSFDHIQGKLIVADLDNDGDPDGIVSGIQNLSVYTYQNGTFTRTDYPQYGFNSGSYSIDAGDIDRNGFIDILHAGRNYEGHTTPSHHLLLNNGTALAPSAEALLLEGAYRGDLFLGDFEGDGDLDVLSSGSNGVLLNRGNKIVDYGPYFPANGTWYANWWDLDHDGELEIIRTDGQPGSGSVYSTKFFERHYPALTISTTLSFDRVQTQGCVVADYDSDGDFDLLFQSLEYVGGNVTRIFRNDNGNFVDSGQSFPWGESTAFGDINNDGLYDVIIGGAMTSTWMNFETAIYLNQGNGTFAKHTEVIPSTERAHARVADFDNDGDLDILSLAGAFMNNSASVNAAPLPPASAAEIVSGSSVEFSWQAGSDDKTPLNGLTYNISVRSEDGSIVVPAHALSNGTRQLYNVGNAWNNLSYTLSCLKAGKYYWKVQTLDASYKGSAFSSERSFTIERSAPVAPQNVTAKAFSDQGVDLQWTDVSDNEDEFIIFKKLVGDLQYFYAIDTVSANVTSYRDTIAVYHDQTYIYRVVASNCAYPDEFATESLPVTTFPRAFVETDWLPDNTSITIHLLGDYDRDGDLDLVVSDHLTRKTKLLRFNGVGFEDSGIQIEQTIAGGRWIDYDNNGYLDLLLYGTEVFDPTITLYANNSGSAFTKVPAMALPTTVKAQAGISTGDYDNDGDEDLLVQADSYIHIYDNDGLGKFTRNVNIQLSGHIKSTQAWADYDLDGDLDILANRKKSDMKNTLVIFENNSDKTFTPVEFVALEGTNNEFLNFTGDMAWGDYDNDGYPDIVVAGQNAGGNGFAITRIYHNEKNKTFAQKAELTQLTYDVNVEWGDYDNDGDLDVFAYGDPFGGFSARTRVYRNDGTRFIETNIDYLLLSRQFGKAAIGDIDRDGDLDYVLSGQRDYVTQVSAVYRNTYAESWGRPNHKPSIPTGLKTVDNADGSVTLSWNRSEDAETPSTGLTYNLRVVDNNGLLLVNSYTTGGGQLMLVTPGNASMNSVTLKNLKSGSYTWSVQSIDKGFASSDFSEGKQFSTSAVVGIADEITTGIRLYPNPVSDELTISSGLPAGELRISVTNALGQHIEDMPLSSETAFYDMRPLPSGVYLITVYHNNSRIKSEKIIKR
ncbi:FG-GAP-like repeat-containing protein [Chryseolinea sp. T2]|uniref:FG-GAP-like repeat-containing protein n=1 Tax=Chryseolinea sp. T2 TaxID=3129255 RepID=UPI00307868B1